ncbi:hypothetical protein CONPUDRAFT_140047 [Coniophora puteana RWD-64-598 SS2]|uniref:Geranylgeranyl pyrophosphate synthetase n=1 Tax=Coniophora puteana (strain RWD-64-598) TaxID=741705 RepID=A0A5M3M962_CONPW|nr:uncharacterized protein CONPUDRAFT_140047 [Coniophora puteana RWD-64-598 SS2]EIW75633.1 hypothetical protein CONPUDRAFT_140047 [Coniophora puteana RWD-64-598 SS2]
MYHSPGYRRKPPVRASFARPAPVDIVTPAFVKAHLDGRPLKEYTAPYSPIGVAAPTTSSTPALAGRRGNSDTEIAITDVEAVSSYSWVDTEHPEIIVPGSPNIWNNTNPQSVPQDSGVVFSDQNGARMGSDASSMTPLFASIEALRSGEVIKSETKEKFDYTSLDLITDRNNLRKLLRWATDAEATTMDGHGAEPFRIDVQRVGKTCVFTRCDAQVFQYISEFRGFGQEYEKAATTPTDGCEDATGHHRIIKMNFGGISILLRSEVDAWVGTEGDDDDSDDDNDLVAALRSMTVGSSATKSAATSVGNAAVSTESSTIFGLSILLQRSGDSASTTREPVAQSSLIKIKTRASHRPLDWDEAYPQLYLSQTPHFYLARHQRGLFSSSIEKYTLEGLESDLLVGPEVRKAREGLKKLRGLLREILDEVRKVEDESAQLCLVREGKALALYKRVEGTGKRLSEEVVRVMKSEA